MAKTTNEITYEKIKVKRDYTYSLLHRNLAMVNHLLKGILALRNIPPFLDLWFVVLLDILIFLLTALRWAIDSIHACIFFLLDALRVKIGEWKTNETHVDHENVAHEIQIIDCDFVN